MLAFFRRRKTLPEASLVDDGTFEVVAESSLLRHLVDVPITSADDAEVPGTVARPHADRTVTASGLGVAQVRARVTDLVARLGGDVDGWQLLAPPADTADQAGYHRDVR